MRRILIAIWLALLPWTAFGQGATTPVTPYGAYNSGGITLNTGTLGAFQLNSSGYLLTAPASTQISTSGAYGAVTVGATSGQVFSAKTRVFLDLINPNPVGSGIVVGCAFGTTAVLYAAGTITLQPGQGKSWEGSFVPGDAINCIASAASTAFTAAQK